LAKVNGLSQADLSAYLIISQRRDVWLNLSNAKSGSEHSGKHSGRPITKYNGGIPSIPGIANGSLAELQTLILLSANLDLLTQKNSSNLLMNCEEVGKMLNGLQKSLSPKN
jgi:hypothetical protein